MAVPSTHSSRVGLASPHVHGNGGWELGGGCSLARPLSSSWGLGHSHRPEATDSPRSRPRGARGLRPRLWHKQRELRSLSGPTFPKLSPIRSPSLQLTAPRTPHLRRLLTLLRDSGLSCLSLRRRRPNDNTAPRNPRSPQPSLQVYAPTGVSQPGLSSTCWCCPDRGKGSHPHTPPHQSGLPRSGGAVKGDPEQPAE